MNTSIDESHINDDKAPIASVATITMNNQEALNIIQTLINGINPLSDEPLDDNSLCLYSDIQRALQTAIVALESRIQADISKSKLPANAGKPWDDAR